jgi:hypothetical protein
MKATATAGTRDSKFEEMQMSDRARDDGAKTNGGAGKFPMSRRWSLVFLVLAVTAGGVAYRIILHQRLEQTSLLFIGLPALLAIILALTPDAKSTTGGIMKGITFALLLSGPLLGEGFICILMAAPIFLLLGLVVGLVNDHARRKKGVTLGCLVLIFLPMSLEGTSARLSFNRAETVAATQVVNASAREVEEALGESPHIGTTLPLYLRMRFPRPTEASGSGLEVGATRTIHFAGGEGHPGDLVLRVRERRPGYVRFQVVSDQSKVAHWLDWKSSEIEWSALDGQHTRVTWTIHFERRLDPAWYFGPWERYATGLAAEYLIEANAIPAGARRGA